MFEFNNNGTIEQYSIEQVQAAAKKAGVGFDDYIQKYNIKELGKTTPTSPGADVEVTTAPDMDFKSANISLELPQADTVDSTLNLNQEIELNAAEIKEKKSKSYFEDIGGGKAKIVYDTDYLGRPIDRDTQEIIELDLPIDLGESAPAQIAENILLNIERLSVVDNSIGAVAGMLFNKPEFTKFNLEKVKKSQERSKKLGGRGFTDVADADTASEAIGDIVSGFSSAFASFGASALEIAAGGPVLLGADMISKSIIDANEVKADSKGISLEKLIENDEVDYIQPFAYGLLGTAAEYVGFKNATRIFSAGSLPKKIFGYLFAGTGEASTELFQGFTEQLNKNYAIARGKGDIFDFSGKNNNLRYEIFNQTAKDWFTSKEGLESFLQGFAGGAGARVMTNTSMDDIIQLVGNARQQEEINSLEKNIEELANVRAQIISTNDNTVLEGLKKRSDELQSKIKFGVTKANGILFNANKKDYSEVKSMKQLADLQIKKVNELKEKNDNGEITNKEYNEALQGYKEEYVKAKNAIKGIAQNISDKSNKQAQRVNQIYEQKGNEGVAEIIELYRPMATNIARQRRNAPNYDEQLLVDEILTGERGIIDLISSYNPDKNPGVPLSAYVNSFVGARAIEASRRVLGEEFTVDVTESKKVEAQETAEDTISKKEEAQQEVKKALAQDLNLSEDTQNEIVTAVEKTLGTKLPAVTDKGFKASLTKGFRTELTNTLKKVFGRTASYEQFLRDNFEKIYPAIPQETINKKFKEFNEAVVDPETGKQLRERTAEGKKVFKKRDIAKAEFIKYFLDAPGNVKGARKTSLAEVIADEVGLDNVLGALTKPEVLKKFKAIQELQGQEVPSNFIEIISEKIDRAINYLDGLQKNNNQLYVSLGFPELSIAAAKAFLKAAKFVIKRTGSFADALKAGIKALQEYVKSERSKKEIADTVPTIIKSIEDFGNQSKTEQVTNAIDTIVTKDKVFNILNDSISNLKDKISKAKNLSQKEKVIFEFLKYELAGLVKINIGGKKKVYLFKEDSVAVEFAWEWFTNQGILDKDTSKIFKLKDVRQGKSIMYKDQNINDFRGKHRPSAPAIKITKSWENTQKTLSNKTEAQDIMNDAYAEYAAKKIATYASNNRIDLIDDYLEINGLASDSAIRLSAKFGAIEKASVGDKLVYEHTPPIKQTRDDIKNVVSTEKSYSENYENVLKILKKTRVDFITEKTAGKLNATKKGKESGRFPERFKNIINVENDLFSLRKEIIADQPVGSLSRQFNKLLEKSTKVDFAKRFEPVEARIMGRGKGKKFFIPYSADDFVGLLYTTLSGGKVGDMQMDWYKENLLRPFSRGIQQYETAKQTALREWAAIKKEAKKDVPGGLDKKNTTGLTNQDAIRIYIWKTQQMEIPGAEKSFSLINENLKIVKNNSELKTFAERLMALNPEGYPPPSNNWDSGDITTDIVSYINNVKRSEFLTEWRENVDEIFSDQNKLKLKALYGERYVDALDDMLYRMKTGVNRKSGASKIERQFMDWTNNSIGAIMFFNARSAVLQTLSSVNFINFSDNNPINAGIAFFNQKQYWDDFTTLFNSDFLKQRRSGLQTDVSADEIARAAKSSKNKARAALSAILKFGFTPTQIADSFAIASGGATFYRNRIKKYLKEGLEQSEAEAKAFTDFQEIAEETQQSARPDRISSQQAGSLGRLILAFGNTPMQYARLVKKASLDLINGRGDWKTNISKIAYYSVIQNIIFSSLQQGLFALLFDDEDDEETKSRLFRIGNSSIDTLLRGSGVYGAAAATVKNMIFKIIDELKSKRPDFTEVAIEATSISPPINSKLRKLQSAGKTFTYKQSKEKVYTEGFSLENPAFLAAGKVISAATNLPADRVVQKADHLYTAMQPETELWQSIALSLGWGKWELGMIEKQTKKSLKPISSDFKIKSFKGSFKSKKFKTK